MIRQLLATCAIAHIFLGCIGCAYVSNRGRDFRDVFTLAVEDQKASCCVEVILPLGVSVAEGRGIGLRDGYMGRYDYKERIVCYPPAQGGWEWKFKPDSDVRNKQYHLVRGTNPDLSLLKIEANFGMYYGFRAGVNILEFADFILGISTFDLLDDDLESKGAGSNQPFEITR